MTKEKSAEWKRQATAACDIEITEKSAPAARVAYVSVASKLEAPRYLMGTGYQDQRREWLGVIADALEKGEPIPTADFLEVVAMLKKVADGELPAKAFGLINARGRKKETERLNQMHTIADTVFRYSKTGHALSVEPSSKPGTPESAYCMAAKCHGVKESHARDAWELFGESLSQFYAGGLWEEPFPSVKKLNRKKRKTPPRK